MPDLCFTFNVNITLFASNSCYFWGNWVLIHIIFWAIGFIYTRFVLYYYYLLLSRGYCNYSLGNLAKGVEWNIYFGFHGPIYNFFGRRGPRLNILGQIENFLCVHTY